MSFNVAIVPVLAVCSLGIGYCLGAELTTPANQRLTQRISKIVMPLLCAAIAATIPGREYEILALTIMTGIGYGFVKNMTSYWECPEYFDLPNDRTSDRLIKAIIISSNDLWPTSLIAGLIFSQVVEAKVSIETIASYFVIIAAISLIATHVFSRIAQKLVEKEMENPLARIRYPQVAASAQAQGAYTACRMRTLYSNKILGCLALALIGDIILARSGITRL